MAQSRNHSSASGTPRSRRPTHATPNVCLHVSHLRIGCSATHPTVLRNQLQLCVSLDRMGTKHRCVGTTRSGARCTHPVAEAGTHCGRCRPPDPAAPAPAAAQTANIIEPTDTISISTFTPTDNNEAADTAIAATHNNGMNATSLRNMAEHWGELNGWCQAAERRFERLAEAHALGNKLTRKGQLRIGDRQGHMLERGDMRTRWDNQAVRAAFLQYATTLPDATAVIRCGLDEFALRGRLSAVALRHIDIDPATVGTFRKSHKPSVYIKPTDAAPSADNYQAVVDAADSDPGITPGEAVVAAHQQMETWRSMRDELARRIARRPGHSDTIGGRDADGRWQTVGTIETHDGEWRFDHDALRKTLLERYQTTAPAPTGDPDIDERHNHAHKMAAAADVLTLVGAGGYKSRWTAKKLGQKPTHIAGKLRVTRDPATPQ